jgi:antitoxin VapB
MSSICFGRAPLWHAARQMLRAWAFRGMAERRVKLFRNGRNQAVRIPREFELPGADATIRREGRRLIIEPAPPKSLLAVLATLATLGEDFPPTEDRQAEPIDI